MNEKKQKIPRRAYFNKKDELIIRCPYCEKKQVIDDIPGDDFDKYRCILCRQFFYAKSVLRFLVRKTNEDDTRTR